VANRDQVAEKRVVRDCEVLVGPYPRKCFEHALDGGIGLCGFERCYLLLVRFRKQ